MSFFFSKASAKKFQDVDLLRRMGCKLCPLYSSDAKNKDMPAAGSNKPEVVLLGQAPDSFDDRNGTPFTGNIGTYLRGSFTDEQWKKVRLNNIVRTYPEDRPPSFEEIECCRVSVETDILLHKPRAVFAFGDLSVNWFLHQQQKPSIQAWRGHRFVTKIQDHSFWVFPMHSPEFVMSAFHLDPVFKLDIKNAYRFLARKLEPEVVDFSAVQSVCRNLYDLSEIKKALMALYKEPELEIDLETVPVLPYNPKRKILSMAIGTMDNTIAFPWQHPQAKWTVEEFQQLKKLVHVFLRNKKQVKIAHNASFEIEHLVVEFNDPAIALCNWKDTMSSAYCLGYGGNVKSSEGGTEKLFKGLLSLDNLSRVYLGFSLKEQSAVDVTNLEKFPIDQVLTYNSYDVAFGHLISQKLDADIAFERLEGIRREHDRRVPTATLTQWKGLVVSEVEARKQSKIIEGRIEQVYKEVIANPSVVEFIAKFSKFNLGAPADVANLFRYLGYNVIKKDKKDASKDKVSSDDEILKAIDHPVAKNILEYREAVKLKSTYLDIYLPESENYIVYPDGKLHPRFSTHFTSTGRWSSQNPNVQNAPKKKNKEVRRIIVAPPGHIQTSCDYGQIEYRVLVMASQDPKLVEYVGRNIDIHSDWGIRIAKKYPKRVGEKLASKWLDSDVKHLKDQDKLFAAFRDTVKNGWVFASFFGAGVEKLSVAMNLPISVVRELREEFWNEFAGVSAWQKKQHQFYKDNGYVESLTGRRRYAPMQGGEVINFGIQGLACDIVVDGMNRLTEYAIESGQHQFIAVSMVHDDLQFYLPLDTWKKDLEKIIFEMLNCKYGFLNVPLAVEAAAGPNWLDMNKIGTFTSDKTEEIHVP